jgi:hypothetical protein
MLGVGGDLRYSFTTKAAMHLFVVIRWVVAVAVAAMDVCHIIDDVVSEYAYPTYAFRLWFFYRHQIICQALILRKDLLIRHSMYLQLRGCSQNILMVLANMIVSSQCIRVHKLSKTLLCKQSPYFAATFEGKFLEGEEQSTTLAEIDDVVSVRSFELLLQWLYLGRVVFGKLKPEDTITAAIEFVRIADMCGVTGMETLMAGHIKTVIIDNPSPNNGLRRSPDANTYYLTTKHIISVANLPKEHPVRKLLAAAAVEGYLRDDDHKFLKETQELASFSADLLGEVKATLNSARHSYGSSIVVTDHFSGVDIYLAES